MALSGKNGKVWYIDDSCPIVECSIWGLPVGTPVCWFDQITKFTVEESVQKWEGGHDKSQGCQDTCAGTWRAGITLDAKSIPEASGLKQARLHAGKVLYLQLYPAGKVGDCAIPLQGWAMIDRVSYTYDQETGLPIAYTATMSSKGPWEGIGPDANHQIGGFECECTQ